VIVSPLTGLCGAKNPAVAMSLKVYAFLENPEGCWKKILAKRKVKYENSLFPKKKGKIKNTDADY